MFKKYAMLAVAISLGLGSLSAAAVDLKSFRVGYGEGTTLDENFGKTWANGVAVTPPDYACGRRVQDVGLLTWIAFGGAKVGKNPYVTIDVWLPRPNCTNKTQIIVEKNGDGADYQPPNPNTFPLEYVELETYGSSRWIDKDGKVKPLNIPQLPYTIKQAQWAGMPAQLGALKAQIIDPATQSRAYFVAQQRAAEVNELAGDLDGRIALRRRTSLPDRESALRQAEDAASMQVATAATQLAVAARYAQSARYAEAYVATDVAAAAMNQADAYVTEAEELVSARGE
jgi:hypothetical protein